MRIRSSLMRSWIGVILVSSAWLVCYAYPDGRSYALPGHMETGETGSLGYEQNNYTVDMGHQTAHTTSYTTKRQVSIPKTNIDVLNTSEVRETSINKDSDEDFAQSETNLKILDDLPETIEQIIKADNVSGSEVEKNDNNVNNVDLTECFTRISNMLSTSEFWNNLTQRFSQSGISEALGSFFGFAATPSADMFQIDENAVRQKRHISHKLAPSPSAPSFIKPSMVALSPTTPSPVTLCPTTSGTITPCSVTSSPTTPTLPTASPVAPCAVTPNPTTPTLATSSSVAPFPVAPSPVAPCSSANTMDVQQQMHNQTPQHPAASKNPSQNTNKVIQQHNAGTSMGEMSKCIGDAVTELQNLLNQFRTACNNLRDNLSIGVPSNCPTSSSGSQPCQNPSIIQSAPALIQTLMDNPDQIIHIPEILQSSVPSDQMSDSMENLKSSLKKIFGMLQETDSDSCQEDENDNTEESQCRSKKKKFERINSHLNGWKSKKSRRNHHYQNGRDTQNCEKRLLNNRPNTVILAIPGMTPTTSPKSTSDESVSIGVATGALVPTTTSVQHSVSTPSSVQSTNNLSPSIDCETSPPATQPQQLPTSTIYTQYSLQSQPPPQQPLPHQQQQYLSLPQLSTKSQSQPQPQYVQQSQPSVQQEPQYLSLTRSQPLLQSKTLSQEQPQYLQQSQPSSQQETQYLSQPQLMLQQEPQYVSLTQSQPLLQSQTLLQEQPQYLQPSQPLPQQETQYLPQPPLFLQPQPSSQEQPQCLQQSQPSSQQESQYLSQSPLLLRSQLLLQEQPQYLPQTETQTSLQQQPLSQQQSWPTLQPESLSRQQTLASMQPQILSESQFSAQSQPTTQTHSEPCALKKKGYPITFELKSYQEVQEPISSFQSLYSQSSQQQNSESYSQPTSSSYETSATLPQSSSLPLVPLTYTSLPLIQYTLLPAQSQSLAVSSSPSLQYQAPLAPSPAPPVSQFSPALLYQPRSPQYQLQSLSLSKYQSHPPPPQPIRQSTPLEYQSSSPSTLQPEYQSVQSPSDSPNRPCNCQTVTRPPSSTAVNQLCNCKISAQPLARSSGAHPFNYQTPAQSLSLASTQPCNCQMSAPAIQNCGCQTAQQVPPTPEPCPVPPPTEPSSSPQYQHDSTPSGYPQFLPKNPTADVSPCEETVSQQSKNHSPIKGKNKFAKFRHRRHISKRSHGSDCTSYIQKPADSSDSGELQVLQINLPLASQFTSTNARSSPPPCLPLTPIPLNDPGKYSSYESEGGTSFRSSPGEYTPAYSQSGFPIVSSSTIILQANSPNTLEQSKTSASESTILPFSISSQNSFPQIPQITTDNNLQQSGYSFVPVASHYPCDSTQFSNENSPTSSYKNSAYSSERQPPSNQFETPDSTINGAAFKVSSNVNFNTDNNEVPSKSINPNIEHGVGEITTSIPHSPIISFNKNLSKMSNNRNPKEVDTISPLTTDSLMKSVDRSQSSVPNNQAPTSQPEYTKPYYGYIYNNIQTSYTTSNTYPTQNTGYTVDDNTQKVSPNSHHEPSTNAQFPHTSLAMGTDYIISSSNVNSPMKLANQGQSAGLSNQAPIQELGYIPQYDGNVYNHMHTSPSYTYPHQNVEDSTQKVSYVSHHDSSTNAQFPHKGTDSAISSSFVNSPMNPSHQSLNTGASNQAPIQELGFISPFDRNTYNHMQTSPLHPYPHQNVVDSTQQVTHVSQPDASTNTQSPQKDFRKGTDSVISSLIVNSPTNPSHQIPHTVPNNQASSQQPEYTHQYDGNTYNHVQTQLPHTYLHQNIEESTQKLPPSSDQTNAHLKPDSPNKQSPLDRLANTAESVISDVTSLFSSNSSDNESPLGKLGETVASVADVISDASSLMTPNSEDSESALRKFENTAGSIIEAISDASYLLTPDLEDGETLLKKLENTAGSILGTVSEVSSIIRPDSEDDNSPIEKIGSTAGSIIGAISNATSFLTPHSKDGESPLKKLGDTTASVAEAISDATLLLTPASSDDETPLKRLENAATTLVDILSGLSSHSPASTSNTSKDSSPYEERKNPIDIVADSMSAAASLLNSRIQQRQQNRANNQPTAIDIKSPLELLSSTTSALANSVRSNSPAHTSQIEQNTNNLMSTLTNPSTNGESPASSIVNSISSMCNSAAVVANTLSSTVSQLALQNQQNALTKSSAPVPSSSNVVVYRPASQPRLESNSQIVLTLPRDQVCSAVSGGTIIPGDIVTFTLNDNAALVGKVVDFVSPISFSLVKNNNYRSAQMQGNQIWNVPSRECKDKNLQVLLDTVRQKC